MQTIEISIKTLNADAIFWIEKLRQVLLIQDKGKGTVKNYTAEMMLLFKYYNSKTVATITEEEIQQYIVFIKTVHKVGRAKCRSVASACAFFYKQVIKMPYILPSALYPPKHPLAGLHKYWNTWAGTPTKQPSLPIASKKLLMIPLAFLTKITQMATSKN